MKKWGIKAGWVLVWMAAWILFAAPSTVTKRLIYKEDVKFGTSTDNVPTSTGGTMKVTQINASHIPMSNGSGSIETALTNTLDFTNVTLFGAVCDNATNNDNAIQATVDNVVASGVKRKILIPSGCLYSYNINWKGVPYESWEAPLMINDTPTWPTASLTAGMATDGEWLAIAEYGADRVTLMHLADRRNPVFVKLFAVGSEPRFVQMAGNYLFVANHGDSTITVYDITSPAAGGTLVATITTAASPKQFIIVGYYLYVVCASGTIQKWDITDPANATLTASHAITGANPLHVSHYKGILTVVGLSGTLSVFPTNLSNEFTLALTGTTHPAVEMVGSYALVTDSSRNKLLVVDVKAPTGPTLVSETDTSESPQLIYVTGDRAYVPSFSQAGSPGHLDCFDISNLLAPVKYKTIQLHNSGSAFITGTDRYLYVSGHQGPITIDVVEIEQPDNGRKKVTGPEIYENNFRDTKKNYSYTASGTYRTVIDNTTLLIDDIYLRCGLSPTITLPDPSTMTDGKIYRIANVSTGTVTISNAFNGYSGTLTDNQAVSIMPTVFNATYQWDLVGGP